MRRVEWGRTYLWDVFFPTMEGRQGPPSPFDTWFPASTATETLASVSTSEKQVGMGAYALPIGFTEGRVTLKFYDSVDGVLQKWLTEWMDSITNNGLYLRTLDESVRMIYIAKLNVDKSWNSIAAYWVYPKGELTWSGDSQAALVELNLTFVIAGIANRI